MPLFILLAISIVTALHAYVWTRAVLDTMLPPPLFWLGTALITALYASLLVTFFARRTLPTGTARWLKIPVYLWIGYAFYLSIGFFVGDIGGVLWRVVASAGVLAPPNPALELEVARWTARVVLGFAAALTVYGAFGALSTARLRVQRVAVKLPGLAASNSGLRIVQLSDLHIGPTLRDRWLSEVVAKVNALKADVIVITGDIVDGSVEHIAPFVAPLRGLRARFGTYFCTGNHDFYSGADPWCEELSRLGLRPLRNERVALGEPPAIDLAGVDDDAGRHYGKPADFERALERRGATDRPLVLLAHQPQAVVEAKKYGVDLQLSGHTHGGQLWPFHHLTNLQTRFRAGLYHLGDTQLYVSRGTGFWGPPLRLFAPAEIAEITLYAPSRSPDLLAR